MKIKTHSERETRKIAKTLGETIRNSKRKKPLVIGLVGDLGSGKTTFIKGLAKGLGIKRRLTSPTFLIMRSYKIKVVSYKFLFHVDAYRIKKPKELVTLGFKEIISDPKNIVVIEWADNVKRLLPKNRLKINFRHGKEENERTMELKPST